MKKLIQATAICLSVLLMLLCLPLMSAGEDSGQEVSYRRKVISVVYDNSGSMERQSRIHYAQYSLQILLSMLNRDDTLSIIPMNVASGDSDVIEVNMKDGDCSDIIRDIVNRKSITTASGGTPFDSVQKAVNELVSKGLKTVETAGDVEQNEEYWLIILTDGAFESTGDSASALEEAIGQIITGYSGLRTIYLGIGDSSIDLSGCNLSSSAPFTPLKAGEKSSFVEKMQTICNLMSGRYSLSETNFTVSGNKVILDLDKTDFPFRTVSVLLQDCPAKLQSVTYNGQSFSAASHGTLSGNQKVGIDDGSFAVIEGSPFFSNGKMELVFSSEVNADNLTIMGEPALRISPYFEYLKPDGSWQRTDMHYINSNLTKNDYIRVGYDIYEQAHDNQVDLSSIFGDVKEGVSYAGKSYAVGEKIPLVVGVNEIAVSVSVMGGSYLLNSSAVCIISENPSYYRIEASVEEKQGKDQYLSDVHFVVYSDNQRLNKDQLADYTIEIHSYRSDGTEFPAVISQSADGTITAELDLIALPPGEICSVVIRVVSPLNVSREKTVDVAVGTYLTSIDVSATAGNTFSVTQYELLRNRNGIDFFLNANGDPFRFDDAAKVSYKVTLNGKDISSLVTVDGNRLTVVPSLETLGDEASKPGTKVITVTVSSVADPSLKSEVSATFELVKSVLALQVDSGGGQFDITPYKLETNQRGFTFSLTLDGNPIFFGDEEVEWQIRVGNADVSQYMVANGENYVYTPTAGNIGNELTLGNKRVTANVWLKALPAISASCETALNIVDSIWEIQILPDAGMEVDRFAIEDSNAGFRAKVLRDGVLLDQKELERLYENGELKLACGAVDLNFLLPIGREISFEEQDGVGIISYKITRDQFQLLAGVTSMFILNGEKNVHLTCHNAEADTAFVFPPSSPWSYIWRILIILLILYIILYFALWPKCKAFHPGLYVKLSVDSRKVNVRVTKVNMTFIQKYRWHLRRWLPWKLVMNQPDVAGLTFAAPSSKEDQKKQESGVARFKMKPDRGNGIRTFTASLNPDSPQEWRQFSNNLRRRHSSKLDLSPDQVRNMFTLDSQITLNPKLNSSYFATVNKKNEITEVRFYVFLKLK